MTKDQLLIIEKGFWHEGADYYNKHIAKGAVFVFPGMILAKEDGVKAADAAPRWDHLDITREKLLEIADNVAILTYHAEGKRQGAKDPYSGNITTVYQIDNGDPKMIFHQHTPDPIVSRSS